MKGLRFLEIENPSLFSELVISKNHVDLSKISMGSAKKLLWKCNKNHEWLASSVERNRGRGCPYCAGVKVCYDTSLLFLRPDLCKEWNYEKNITVNPEKVTQFSEKKVWWKCEYGHEWQAHISNRSSGTKCKKCVNPNVSEIETIIFYYIKFVFGEVFNSYKIFENNKFEVDIFVKQLNLAIEYDGVYFHKQDKKIERDKIKNNLLKEKNIELIRIREEGLPSIHHTEFCIRSNKNKNEIKNVVLEILNHIQKKYDISQRHIELINSVKKIDFETNIIPKEFFSYKLQQDNLLIKNPKIASEWHYELNQNLRPEHVTIGSNRKVWWICGNSKNHVWKSTVNDRKRINGNGCPFCSNKKVCVDNCLETTNTTLTSQWDYTKNGQLTPKDVLSTSQNNIWWLCENNHSWQQQIIYRNNKIGGARQCPTCRKERLNA